MRIKKAKPSIFIALCKYAVMLGERGRLTYAHIGPRIIRLGAKAFDKRIQCFSVPEDPPTQFYGLREIGP